MIKIKLLFVVYTERCNSRCSVCDYWKTKVDDNPIHDNEIIDTIDRLVVKGLETLIFTGGEPLLRAKELFKLCRQIKEKHPKLSIRLLTNGILLEKYIEEIQSIFDVVVVSFDAINREGYKRLRGVDGFEKVIRAIKILKASEVPIEIRLRTVVQKENYKHIPEIIDLAALTKVNTISFLPVDIKSDFSFGRSGNKQEGKRFILNTDETEELEKIVQNILESKKHHIKSGLLVERGKDLLNVCKYYKNELKNFTESCNAPEYSVVLNSNGDVLPCFFIKQAGNIRESNIDEILNSQEFIRTKKAVLKGIKKECKQCVCPINF